MPVELMKNDIYRMVFLIFKDCENGLSKTSRVKRGVA